MFAAGASDQPPNSCQDGPGRASMGRGQAPFGFLVDVANPTFSLTLECVHAFYTVQPITRVSSVLSNVMAGPGAFLTWRLLFNVIVLAAARLCAAPTPQTTLETSTDLDGCALQTVVIRHP